MSPILQITCSIQGDEGLTCLFIILEPFSPSDFDVNFRAFFAVFTASRFLRIMVISHVY